MELMTSIPSLVVWQFGNATPLKIPPLWWVRRELSGGGGAADPHGHIGVFGCLIPADPSGKVEGN